jgi:hypothetical protein
VWYLSRCASVLLLRPVASMTILYAGTPDVPPFSQDTAGPLLPSNDTRIIRISRFVLFLTMYKPVGIQDWDCDHRLSLDGQSRAGLACQASDSAR